MSDVKYIPISNAFATLCYASTFVVVDNRDADKSGASISTTKSAYCRFGPCLRGNSEVDITATYFGSTSCEVIYGGSDTYCDQSVW